MHDGKEVDAAREFKAAIPILIFASRENSNVDDASLVAARNRRLQDITEAYIWLLADKQGKFGDAAVETFELADAIRSRSVRRH